MGFSIGFASATIIQLVFICYSFFIPSPYSWIVLIVLFFISSFFFRFGDAYDHGLETIRNRYYCIVMFFELERNLDKIFKDAGDIFRLKKYRRVFNYKFLNDLYHSIIDNPNSIQDMFEFDKEVIEMYGKDIVATINDYHKKYGKIISREQVSQLHGFFSKENYRRMIRDLNDVGEKYESEWCVSSVFTSKDERSVYYMHTVIFILFYSVAFYTINFML